MTFKAFDNFSYSGIYMSAYLNDNGEIKKNVIHHKKELYENKKHYMKPIFYRGQIIEPNAIQIDCTKITTIDIDKPEKCIILDKLMKDCNFYVKTRKGYHFYFNNCNKIILSQKNKRRVLCDIADINCNTLYYCPTYTDDDNNEYCYEIIKSKKLVDMPDYAIDWCNQLIKNTFDNSDKPNKTYKKSFIEKLEYLPNYDTNIFNKEVIKHIYEIYLKSGKFETPNTWYSIAYFSRHLNNSYNIAELFDEYSRKIKKYENRKKEDNINTFYGDDKYNINFNEEGILIECAKLDYEYYNKHLIHLKKDKYENVYNKINTQYLYTDDNKHIYSKWMKTNKCLMIKSAYGTGKTYLFKRLMDEYKYKKVLFITYRQSLAFSLIEELRNDYGFKSYLDEGVKCAEEDKLIIQLDSLEKLNNRYQFELQRRITNQYDLIVMDEIEGILNHFSYEKIDQHSINNVLEKLLKKSKKILVLDGDLSRRSYDFIDNLDIDYTIYNNEYQPTKKHYIFTCDKEYYNKQIEDDLKNGLKVVIVSMSAGECNYYEDLYKSLYRVIKHTGIHKDVETLMDVNNKWDKCDLLCYSPVVEAGVDYNKKYFNKCYVILSIKSTSYRALSQMCNRVRHYTDNNILCYYNEDQIKYNTHLYPYTYEDFRMKKYGDIEMSNLLNINIHNSVEKYNTEHYLIASFIYLIHSKGATFEKLDNEKSKISTKSTERKKKNILEANDINLKQLREILEKQKKNKSITEKEQYELDKYQMKNLWLFDTLDENIIDKHYGKESILNNYLNLISDEDEFNIKNDNHIHNIKNRRKEIKKLITLMGFNLEDRTIGIIHDDFEKRKEMLLTHINSNSFKIIFDKSRKTFEKSRIGEIFRDYGLCFKSSIKERITIDKKQKDIYHHKLENIDIIKEYIDRSKNN